MRGFARLITPSLLLTGLFACSAVQNDRAEQVKDSWYNPPKAGSSFHAAKPLPVADFSEVSPDKEPQAEKLLRETACIEVSNGRAAELVDHAIETPAGTRLYLVRGVYFNRSTGKFNIFLTGGELLVEHGSLGHTEVPMKRQVLVVCLRQKPEAVYTDCSMAE